MISVVERRGPVSFPAFTGERVYMREFTKCGGLPSDLSRWQVTVDEMLAGFDFDGPIYLMVDQSFVKDGETHRRGCLHVDGSWDRTKHGHQGGGGGHGHRVGGDLLVLASSDLGCRAVVGEVEGSPGDGGDCSHLDVSGCRSVLMSPGVVWCGDALTMLHESLPVERDCERTVVRLNVWRPS